MMKKLLIILLALSLCFTLAACGGDDSAVDGRRAADKALEKAKEVDSFSVEAVEYFLEIDAGIQLEDLEPDWEWELANEFCAYGDKAGNGYGHAAIQFTKVEGEITNEEYDAWYNKVFAATAAASQDGYNIIGYEFVGEGEDALAETTLEESLGGFMQGWAFRVNDKIMVVYISQDYDNDKDSEIGNLLYYNGAEVDIGYGLQKSWNDTMGDLEELFEENEDEIKDAVDDYLK